MSLCRLLIFTLLFTFSFANENNIVYVENLDNKTQNSLTKEFFKKNSAKYTLSIATLQTNKHNPIEFFKTYKLKNAIAYKYKSNLQYTKIISGLYNSYKEAKSALDGLDSRLIQNKPYVTKLIRHQELYEKYNTNSSIQINNSKQNIIPKRDSIFLSEHEDSVKLKEEILKNGSNLYALSIATINASKEDIEKFFKYHDLDAAAIAHVYGKNKDKARVVYGLFSSYKDAKKAIDKLSSVLKANQPYATKMKHVQSFYKKYNSEEKQEMVKLEISDKKTKSEKVSKPKISPEIKLVQVSSKKYNSNIKPTLEKKETKKEIKKTKEIKEAKKTEKKEVKKKSSSNSGFLKKSKVEDIYYVESKNSFNILNEVFLNDGSSFYTIDLGEIRLNEYSIEEFFKSNDIKDNALSYKYGDNKEYARAILGAYETKIDAQDAVKELNLDIKNIRVSNIKNHQKLFKMYHEDILKKPARKKEASKQKISQNQLQETNSSDIVYLTENIEPSLKDEFFSENSNFYTITMITFHKNDLSPKDFISRNSSNLDKNFLAFSLGSSNNYYRVFYGAFKTSKEAQLEIENFDRELLGNRPYVSKVSTMRKRFESYNNRKVSDYIDSALNLNRK